MIAARRPLDRRRLHARKTGGGDRHLVTICRSEHARFEFPGGIHCELLKLRTLMGDTRSLWESHCPIRRPRSAARRRLLEDYLAGPLKRDGRLGHGLARSVDYFAADAKDLLPGDSQLGWALQLRRRYGRHPGRNGIRRSSTHGEFQLWVKLADRKSAVAVAKAGKPIVGTSRVRRRSMNNLA